MKEKWFIEGMKGDRNLIENSLRDMDEVDSAPHKEIKSICEILDF